MNCIRCEEQISDYLEGALDASQLRAVEAHFASCSACRELVNGVREVMSWGRTIFAPEAPAWLPGRIIANTPSHAMRRQRDTTPANHLENVR